MKTNLNSLNGKKHIHFIGIGGSGMYPLAQILHYRGFYLTGSDNNETETLDAVRKMGIPVFLGQRKENIEGADLIVHSAAIMSDNEELIAAKESGALVLERSDLLGMVSASFDNAICISGTHGKTTVSSMITQIFMEAERDPSAVIGGKLDIIGGSGRVGKSDDFICEACEYVDTFLKLSPDISVVLNIDYDHMEYFKTKERLLSSFRKFSENASKLIIYNGDDTLTKEALEEIKDKNKISFGYKETNKYYPKNIDFSSPINPSFSLFKEGEKISDITLSVPGEHNILNAVCAAAVALEAGISIQKIKSALKNFRGAHRRFEILGTINGITIADDYAHHPAELEVTLKTAKKLGFKRVIAVFQPFTFSRTSMLLNEFSKALSIADKAVLSAIMGSREKNTFGIKSADLAEKIPDCVHFETFEEIKDFCLKFSEEGDLIITLGCGDIYKVARLMLQP